MILVLSKRERYIGVITVAVLGILCLDQFVVGPLLARKAELDSQLISTRLELDTGQKDIDNMQRRTPKWNQMLKSGLRQDESAEEGQLIRNVIDWAQEAGMSLSSVKRERMEKEKDFYRITVRATGNGQMAQIGKFMYRIQTAGSPVRVSDLTVSSRKEGNDDLTFVVGVSTIFLAPEADKSRTATAMAREVLP